ncbi:MAG: DUF4232 domain-containing protein [Frankia sp.]|nr:DUF4232 domain-containing protein [Frankia sp.]
MLRTTLDKSARLQALPDLFGSGRHDILVAESASGCCGYFLNSSDARVIRLVSGELSIVRLANGHELNLFFDGGRGDAYAGITCDRAEHLVTGIQLMPTTGRDTFVESRQWIRIEGATASMTLMPKATRRMTAAQALARTRTRCGAMTPDGWAASPLPRACAASSLRFSLGPEHGSATGQHGAILRLTNAGRSVCRLRGYPRVSFADARGALPFRYSDAGSQYVTKAKPATVLLAPGDASYFYAAKYRCDAGDAHAATRVQVRLPDGGGTLGGSFSRGALDVSYCRGGRADPGNAIGVSPIVFTPGAVEPSV